MAISCLKDNVTIAQEEKYLTYGMVLCLMTSTDLLSASCRFVSISWASRLYNYFSHFGVFCMSVDEH